MKKEKRREEKRNPQPRWRLNCPRSCLKCRYIPGIESLQIITSIHSLFLQSNLNPNLDSGLYRVEWKDGDGHESSKIKLLWLKSRLQNFQNVWSMKSHKESQQAQEIRAYHGQVLVPIASMVLTCSFCYFFLEPLESWY